MAKPILIMKHKVMQTSAFTQSHKIEAERLLDNEYHVLFVCDTSINNDCEFEVFNSDNADEITLDKLNEIEKLLIK